MSELTNPGNKLPTRQVCKRYSVCDRTIARWERNPDLNFPKPATINGRKYYDEAELVLWERNHAANARAA